MNQSATNNTPIEGLDTIHRYETPDGVELSLSIAGPLIRALAWCIDLFIRMGCYILAAIILKLLGELGTGIMLVFLFATEWFYPVIFEVTKGGTPGKLLLHLRVVHDDGTPVGGASSLLRNLIRCVDFLPFLNMAGLVAMLCNARFQRIGDLAAGTLVIHNSRGLQKFNIPQAPASPAPIPLHLEEQRLILDFCERTQTLSEERQRELAAHLDILSGDAPPVGKLLSYGNWFLRGRSESTVKPE